MILNLIPVKLLIGKSMPDCDSLRSSWLSARPTVSRPVCHVCWSALWWHESSWEHNPGIKAKNFINLGCPSLWRSALTLRTQILPNTQSNCSCKNGLLNFRNICGWACLSIMGSNIPVWEKALVTTGRSCSSCLNERSETSEANGVPKPLCRPQMLPGSACHQGIMGIMTPAQQIHSRSFSHFIRHTMVDHSREWPASLPARFQTKP